MTIEPLTYQKVTAFKERMQLFDKVNELVGVVNEYSGIEPDATYRIVTATIISATGKLRIMNAQHGIIAGVVSVGDTSAGVSYRKVNVMYYIANGMVPDNILCSVELGDNGLEIVKATIEGDADQHYLTFSLIADGTETPLKVSMARMTELRKN